MSANAEQKSFSGFYEHVRRLANWLRDAIQFAAPIGYEDDAGFHYGADPVRAELDN
jgi:hypothetical protein